MADSEGTKMMKEWCRKNLERILAHPWGTVIPAFEGAEYPGDMIFCHTIEDIDVFKRWLGV